MNTNNAIACSMLMIMLAIVGVADYLTGYDFSLTLFYLIPTVLAGWYLGIRAGILFSFLAATVWMFVDQLAGHVYRHPGFLYWNGGSRFILGAAGSLAAASIRGTFEKQKAAIFELRRTLLNLNEVRAQVPVCSICGQFREDQLFREGVNNFVEEQGEPLSLGRPCPECLSERSLLFAEALDGRHG